MSDESRLQFAHSAVRSVIYWPRSAKKALMVSADLIALPLILWLAITLRLGVLDRAPTRATVTSAPLDPPAGATGDGALSPGETA